MKIKMFAIRHNPTGFYLPETPRGRGYTHTTPQPPSAKEPPRLLHNQTAAKLALGAWLKGVQWMRGGYDSYSGDYDESIDVAPPTVERKAEEMEIVPVVLTLN